MSAPARITVFAGHYGSGKTNIAVNYALYLRRLGLRVGVFDLDIVNPYFRTKDSLRLLEENGIALVCSPYANTNVDLPAMPAQANRIFDDKGMYSVVDLGGDDRGACALGRYCGRLNEEEHLDMLLVINKFRPLTADPDGVARMRGEIEAACGVRFTGIVNNSNLGRETQPGHVLGSLEYARAASGATGLPVKMTTARADIAQKLNGLIPGLFALDIVDKPGWSIYEEE